MADITPDDVRQLMRDPNAAGGFLQSILVPDLPIILSRLANRIKTETIAELMSQGQPCPSASIPMPVAQQPNMPWIVRDFFQTWSPEKTPEPEPPSFDRFTDRARKAMAFANQEAQRLNHDCIGTEHILMGLVKDIGTVASAILHNRGLDLRRVRAEVERLVVAGPESVMLGRLPTNDRAKAALLAATDEAAKLHHNYVGTEHLLLGLLRDTDSVAVQVLANLGLATERVRDDVLVLIGCVPEVP